MESPSYSGAPKKKSNVGLIIGIVIAAICFCCILPIGLLVKGGLSAFSSATGLVGCSTDMSDLRNGIVAYAKAHDGKLPEAAHWQDDIQSFVKPTVMPPPMKSVSPAGDVCDADAPSTVSYNADVAGKKLSDIEEKEDTVILFEVTGMGKNKSAKFTQQPFADAPKVLGQPRGWLSVTIHGDSTVTDKLGNQVPVAGAKGFKNVKQQ